MRLFHILQERFGFTRNETTVLLFLCATLIAGSGVRWYRHEHGAPATPLSSYDYAVADSQFAALSQEAADSSRTSSARSHRRHGAQRDTLRPASIELNRADAAEIMRLPGVGPAIAQEILRHRREKGPFRSAEDLLEVRGIGPKKLAKIRPYVTIR